MKIGYKHIIYSPDDSFSEQFETMEEAAHYVWDHGEHREDRVVKIWEGNPEPVEVKDHLHVNEMIGLYNDDLYECYGDESTQFELTDKEESELADLIAAWLTVKGHKPIDEYIMDPSERYFQCPESWN